MRKECEMKFIFLLLILNFVFFLSKMFSGESSHSKGFDDEVSPIIGNDPIGDLTSINLFADVNDF